MQVEGYWSYELCHGLHLRQFHEDRGQDGKVGTVWVRTPCSPLGKGVGCTPSLYACMCGLSIYSVYECVS